MPIYEYKCGHHFEQLQKVTEKPLRTCPKCRKSGLIKLISHTSFQLKGSGWYVTDFKDKKGGSKKSKSDEGSTTVPAAPAKKKESKPIEKSKTTDKK